MNGAGIERRVFVVGVPRSGTTLVQSLLAAHSAVASFTESHFFSQHYKRLAGPIAPILTRDPGPRLRAFLAENEVEEQSVAAALAELDRAATRAGFLPRLRTRELTERFLRLLDELATRQGKRCWVEKTPRHLRFVPYLERASAPDCPTRFVHVIREGLEVVASLYTASQSWSRPYDLDECVRRWNADVAFSVGRIGRANDRFVLYEELTSDPEAAVRRLLDGVGLDWEAGILERRAAGAERFVTREESWKASVGGAVRRSGTSELALSAEQRERASGALRHDLYARIKEHVDAS